MPSPKWYTRKDWRKNLACQNKASDEPAIRVDADFYGSSSVDHYSYTASNFYIRRDSVLVKAIEDLHTEVYSGIASFNCNGYGTNDQLFLWPDTGRADSFWNLLVTDSIKHRRDTLLMGDYCDDYYFYEMAVDTIFFRDSAYRFVNIEEK